MNCQKKVCSSVICLKKNIKTGRTAINENIVVAAKRTEQGIYEAVISTSEVTAAEEDYKEDKDRTEKCARVKINKEGCEGLEIILQCVQQKTENFLKQYEYEHLINKILRKAFRQSKIRYRNSLKSNFK